MREKIREGDTLEVINITKDEIYVVKHSMSPRQVEIMLDGGIINHIKN